MSRTSPAPAAQPLGAAADRPPPLRLRDVSGSAVVAGLIAIVVGFGGTAVVIFAAATAGGLSPEQTASWLAAASIGAGVLGIALTFWTRTPVALAWSTPGAALLVSSIGHYRFSEVVGAYLVAAVAMTVLAASGWLDRLLERVPTALVSAMLAGILLHFVVEAGVSVRQAPLVAGSVVLAFLLVRRWSVRWAVPAGLVVGLVVSAVTGQLHLGAVELRLATPVLTWPTFGLGSVAGIALPLFIVTLTAQNAAGLGVLRSYGYPADAGRLVTATGAGSVVTAFFGSHAINLAAITAALCAGPGAHTDPRRRWPATVSAGVAYIVVGIGGGTLIALFSALPAVLVATLAGVALLSALATSLGGAMTDSTDREAATVCLAVTVSGITVFGVGAPFWGLVSGLAVHVALRVRRQRVSQARERGVDRSAGATTESPTPRPH